MSRRGAELSAFEQWVKPVLIGLAVGVLCCILLLLAMAATVQTVDVPRRVTMPLAVSAGALGAFFAGLTAARISRRRGLLLGALCGLLLFLMILAAGFARYSGVSGGYAMVKMAVLMLCGAAGGFIGVGKRH